MPLAIGQDAPALTLPDQDGKPRSLREWRGRWVVLYFYPRDNTPGCTTEACEFTEGVEAFDAMDAVVVGVSPDTPASHRRFIEKHDLRLTLLSDPDHEAIARYGAWGAKTRNGETKEGVLRGTVLVDPDGKVARVWQNVKAAGHAAAVRQELNALRGGDGFRA